MPEGAALVETTGPWEDYASPSRDLRLLIALDAVRAFPAKVAAHPERFAMPPGRSAAEVRADLEAVLRAESAARRLTYSRSDGSPRTLRLGGLYQMHAGERDRHAHRRGCKALDELGLQAIPNGCGAPVCRGPVESGGERRPREGARDRGPAQS